MVLWTREAHHLSFVVFSVATSDRSNCRALSPPPFLPLAHNAASFASLLSPRLSNFPPEAARRQLLFFIRVSLYGRIRNGKKPWRWTHGIGCPPPRSATSRFFDPDTVSTGGCCRSFIVLVSVSGPFLIVSLLPLFSGC